MATVREATVDDVPGVLRVAQASWNAAYGDFLDDATIASAMEEWYDADSTREHVERDDVAYFVAVEAADAAATDETVVGYVSGGPGKEDDVATLGAIYVPPDRWGEGIGTDLLGRFEAFCRERGYDEIRFKVLSNNDVGASFYRTHGYEVFDEQEADLFGQTVREQVFRGPVD